MHRLAFIVSLLASVAYADDSSFRIGPQIGLTLANASLEPTYGTDARTGLAAGLGGEIRFNERTSLAIEGMYYQGGYIIGGSQATVAFDTIKIPVLFKGRAPITPGFAFTGMFGPALNFVTTSEVRNGASVTNLSSTTEGFLLSLEFGAGLEFAIGETAGLFVDGRYSLGLSNASKIAGASGKQRDIYFVSGIRFGL